MQTIDCPKCSTSINIPVDEADSLGRLRLTCGDCGARVLIKRNPRPLKVSSDIPLTSTRPNQVPVNRKYSGTWAVVVYEVQAQDDGNFRRALLAMPRFRSNPNKLHDATSSLPYTFVGLNEGEASFLDQECGKLAIRYESGPQEWLLDEDLVPRSSSARGPRPVIGHEGSDLEVLSAGAGSSWEIQFDGGRPSQPDLPAQSRLQAAEPRRSRDCAQSLPTVGRLMQSEDEESIVEVEYDDEDPAPEPPQDGLSAITDQAKRLTERMVETAPGAGDDENDAGGAPHDSLRANSDDDFAIVSVNKLPGRKLHIGALHTTISVSANELDVGFQASIDLALEQAHAVLRERAQGLGGTGIVGLRVNQSAIPTNVGWMLVFVVSGTAVA